MKTRTFVFLLITLFGLSRSAFAQQDSSGVYLNSDDFINGRLAYAINCKTQKHKINPYVLLGKSHIKVLHNGVKYKFSKNEIFAYRDCNNSAYRFVGDNYYKILNPGEPILLYETSYVAGKNIVVENYFSVGTGAVTVLSIPNLKRAFPDNHVFHDLLATEFTSGSVALTTYDSYHKMYKVSRLYLNSLQ